MQPKQEERVQKKRTKMQEAQPDDDEKKMLQLIVLVLVVMKTEVVKPLQLGIQLLMTVLQCLQRSATQSAPCPLHFRPHRLLRADEDEQMW